MNLHSFACSDKAPLYQILCLASKSKMKMKKSPIRYVSCSTIKGITTVLHEQKTISV